MIGRDRINDRVGKWSGDGRSLAATRGSLNDPVALLASVVYRRAPSVSTPILGMPSRVGSVVAVTLGGGERTVSQANATAPTNITSTIAGAHCQANLGMRAGPVTTTTFPEVVSRLRRFK